MAQAGVDHVVQAHETKLGALERVGDAVDLVKKIAESVLVVVMTQPRRIVGPDALMRRIAPILRDLGAKEPR